MKRLLPIICLLVLLSGCGENDPDLFPKPSATDAPTVVKTMQTIQTVVETPEINLAKMADLFTMKKDEILTFLGDDYIYKHGYQFDQYNMVLKFEDLDADGEDDDLY